MAVHIEGMGWLGTMIATDLAAAGIDFTWHDARTGTAAWPASTGLVYPAYDPLSLAATAAMRPLIEDGRFGRWCEQATFWHTGRTPPANGAERGTVVPPAAVDLGWVRAAAAPAWQINVQQVVAAVRSRFAQRETDGPRRAPCYVVAHGAGSAAAFAWGWSAKVRVRWPDDIEAASPARPVLYTKTGAYITNYLYPVAGERDVFWAGSTMVHQTRPKALNPETHWAGWLGRVAKETDGRVRVVERLTAPQQGWRPKPAKGAATADARAVWGVHGPSGRRAVVVPPLGASGVRWSALTSASVLALVASELGV